VARFFLDAYCSTTVIKLDDAIGFGSADLVSKDCRTSARGHSLTKNTLQAASVEYVVAEHQSDGSIADKLSADQEGLR